jgi:hypothetical protein
MRADSRSALPTILSCVLTLLSYKTNLLQFCLFHQWWNLAPTLPRERLLSNARTQFTSCLMATDISKVVVERLLCAVKSTSPGIDGLPCWIFQSCSVGLAEIVCHIFNCSVTSDIVPSQWSNALVTLMPKVRTPQHLGVFELFLLPQFCLIY